MRAVVTGGAGFIGSHLAERLQAEGREVKVVDNLTSGVQRTKFLEAAGIAVDQIDIRHPACTELIEKFEPEEIYHLAAQMDVRRSVADPIYDADVNVLGTLRVLQAAVKVGARVMAASSGGCIYGEAPGEMLPLDESSPRNPDSPYGITKAVMEDYLRFYRSTQGLDYVALALSNVYGPRQDPFGEAGVVAIFGRRLIDRRPCVVFGDGEQTRDFCYVADVVDAFMASAERGAGELFNIGTSIETSVNELYWAIAGICAVDSPPTYEPARPGELQRSCLSSAKAERLLDWRPSTDMDAGLRATVEFIRSQA